MAAEAPQPDVRVERRRGGGFRLVPNEETHGVPIWISDAQAQQIVDGLARLGMRASA